MLGEVRPMPRLLCAAVLLALLCPANGFAQGLLEQAREQTHESSHKSSSPSSNSGSSSDDDGLLGPLLYAGLLIPFVVPRAVLGDDGDDVYSFPSWPYERSDGYALLQKGDDGKWWALRASAEEGNDFRSLNRVGLNLFVETATRFGLSSNWSFYDERLPCGCHDQTLLGDTNLLYTFAECESAQYYAGLGCRVLTDDRDTRAGVNFVYGGDLFLVKPVVLSASCDLGNLDAAFVFHARATVGATWRRLEAFGGYDFLRIGSVNLQGPMLGLRVWF
jgi:hypothetical protein